MAEYKFEEVCASDKVYQSLYYYIQGQMMGFASVLDTV